MYVQLYLWRRSTTGRRLKSFIGAKILGQFFPFLHSNLLIISEQRRQNEKIVFLIRLGSLPISKTALINETGEIFELTFDVKGYMLILKFMLLSQVSLYIFISNLIS